MKVARFRTHDAIAFGVLDDPADGSGAPEFVELVADPMVAGYETTGRRFKQSEVQLLSPVLPRSKVVAVGKNYREHAAEMQGVTGGGVSDEPLLFLKPNTSVIGPGDAIVLPPQSQRVEFEGELAVVIGALGKAVPAERALEIVYGFTCANDVSARDLQVADGQWARAKGFDTFCPLGPLIETDLDLATAQLETRLNGAVRQSAPLTDMVHGIADIIAYASSVFTLLPGDVILTGTPAGVGQLQEGDSVSVSITGVGALENPVVTAK